MDRSAICGRARSSKTTSTLGNYAEVKASRVGAGTQMHHFSYVGDADVGARVNIGAGTITVNYDAETRVKSRTVVGDDAVDQQRHDAGGAGRRRRRGHDRRRGGRDARHPVGRSLGWGARAATPSPTQATRRDTRTTAT